MVAQNGTTGPLGLRIGPAIHSPKKRAELDVASLLLAAIAGDCTDPVEQILDEAGEELCLLGSALKASPDILDAADVERILMRIDRTLRCAAELHKRLLAEARGQAPAKPEDETK
ncbi:hypothetical protein [Sorangium sp. So ce1000]|uniref:hypothetical protein n=1 Tax=Sorangium sp. So ce1000 TaxID=3133325 RepID=UPI003F63A7C0